MRIQNGFGEFVCLRSNLSNDNIISAKRPGLKTGTEITFFGLKSGQNLENQAAHPHQEFQGVPRGDQGITFVSTSFLGLDCSHFLYRHYFVDDKDQT